jgi:hypothetical protein
MATQEQLQTEDVQAKQDQQEQIHTEEFEINGDQVVAKIKELIHQGNIRRIILETQQGKTLFELPLTIGLTGAALITVVAPLLAAIGALAAVITKLKVRVERVNTV